jgi:hypothetical protein
MQQMALIVGTDGSPQAEARVRDAALAARERSIPLHVVCSVPPITRLEQRGLDAGLPSDLTHLAGPQGQRNAAIADVRALLGHSAPGIDLHVSASPLKLAKAERTVADRTGGQVYGLRGPSRHRGLFPRLRTRTA